MKIRVYAVPAALALLAASASATLADELLKFKSGYEMMVVSHREEGNMVIVTLDGGGEVGFPKDALDLLEGGKPSSRTGPSPLFNKIHSRVNARQFVAPVAQMPSRFLAKGAASTAGATIGYSYAGQQMQRFSGGPLEMIGPSGKIGVDVRTRGRIRSHPGLEEEDAGGTKVVHPTRTLDAIVPSSKEGD